MRRLALFAFCALCLMTSWISCENAVGGPLDKGSISGSVTDTSGSPVQNVLISVFNAATNNFISSSYTDAAGNYVVSDIPTGQHKVQFYASSQGYLTEWYNDKPDSSSADPIAVTAPNDVSGINAQLIKGGSISGNVANTSGEPIMGVAVSVYNTAGVYVFSSSTDAAGNYVVSPIPSGEYKVHFREYYQGYLFEWYDDKPDFDSADPIAVTAPNEASNVNAQLTRGGSISGNVTDQDGNPLEDIYVYVYDATNDSYISYSYTDAAGNYVLSAIPTGNYKVQFYGDSQGYLIEWHNDKPDSDSADPIAVTAPNDVSGINAQLTMGGSISGNVTDQDGNPIENVEINVYNATTDGYISSSYTDAAGDYVVSGIPSGQHKVQFHGSNVGYLIEWHNDKPDSDSADPITVTAPEDVSGINAQLAMGGNISGNVVSTFGEPLQGVCVRVHLSVYNIIPSAYTDADGNYVVRGIPSGVCKVEFLDYSNGYLSEWYSDKANLDAADAIEVVAPETVSGVNAELAKGGSISGNVTNTSGEPLQDIWIDVYDTASDSWINYTSTDASGNYVVDGIPSGYFKVQFYDYNYGYLGEWYNDKPDLDSADPIAVTAPEDVSGINAQLAMGGSISGTVTNTSGSPIDNISVYVYDAATGDYVLSSYTEADGSYVVSGVPTGNYKVQFRDHHQGYLTEWYNDKPDLDSADPIAVTAPDDVSGINAQLAMGGSISGKVTDQDGNPIENVEINIYNAATVSYITYSYTDSSGNYVVSGIPSGEYKVRFYDNASLYSTEWYNDKPDSSSADPIVVTAPEDVSGINAQLTKGGSISGTVTDQDGSPIAGVDVDAYAMDGDWISGAQTDALGKYVVGGIPSGQYKVQFYASYFGYVNEWYNDKPNSNSADPIAVTAPNEVSGIDAQLIKGGSISGNVANTSGEPIKDIYVLVCDVATGDYLYSSSTDAAGNYVVSGVPSGQYKVHFRDYHQGYLTEWYNDKPDFDSADPIAVTAPNDVSGVNAQLVMGGSISGKVTDQDGNPIENVEINVYTMDGDWIADVQTDADGGYVVSGIPSGQYKLRFYAGYFGYVTEWYNDKPDSSSADPIAVTAPNTASGIDAVLESSPVEQKGSITVSITPNEAVTAGAQWRFAGEGDDSWRDPGTVSDIPVGAKTVEFKLLSGWTTPDSVAVTISADTPASASGEYSLIPEETGSITVSITPSEAVTAGAQWRFAGEESWRNPGAVTGIALGSKTVEFKTISGWTTPANVPVTISADTPATASGAYVQLKGALTVAIASSGAVSKGARWSIDSGVTWRESGATAGNLDPGEYTVELNDIQGWTKPASQTVTILAGEAKEVTVSYIADLTIEATDPDASESKDNGLFTITRTGDASKKLVVTYEVSGSATNGKDYKKLKGKVTIKKNASTALITVKPKNDKFAEEEEDVILTLSNGESATVTIEDND